MRKTIPSRLLLFSFSVLLISMVSCNKELSSTNSGTTSNQATATSSSIAVAADSSGTDSVYMLQSCDHGFFRDSIAGSDLPASILNDLSTNYAGYSFIKNFVIKDSAGTTGGYVVIISFNGKPVGLLFDASGNFQRVLEQREPGDMQGGGWHHGGRFGNRDGEHRDTIALSALPASISSYMSSNYPSDTLVRAFQNRDSSIVVISRDNGIFATLFDASGNFVKRISLAPAAITAGQPFVQIQNITQDSLPAAALTWLTNAYPNYVFETGVSASVNSQVQEYMVVIDADNTKYAVWFDASGKLIAALTIW